MNKKECLEKIEEALKKAKRDSIKYDDCGPFDIAWDVIDNLRKKSKEKITEKEMEEIIQKYD